MKLSIQFILVLFTQILFSQNYPITSITPELKENAKAVVRTQKINVDITSQNQVVITETKVITIFNEAGLSYFDAYQNYDKTTNIKNIEATLLDGNGLEIKKYKRKDFKDYSVADGVSIFNDNRILALSVNPTTYPVTLVYTSEVVSKDTAFLPTFFPISAYEMSLENYEFTVKYLPDLGFKYKEFNFEDFPITKTENNNILSYQLKNIKAIRPESYAPEMGKLFPKAMFALEKFNLVDVEGGATTWAEWGKWYNEQLLRDTYTISDELKEKIKTLVANETNPIAKAKKIYKYVQDKVRYVSVQVGIGGWVPMLASDVDRLSYGDCKALSNYTKALLDAVGIPSYYTVIYGGDDKKDFVEDVVKMQGNHIILTIPFEGQNYFLECTSQTLPFGYLGTFTDDRKALAIKPEGGEIVKTTQYKDEENTKHTKGEISIDETGKMTGLATVLSKGTIYGNKYRIERLEKDKMEEYYKDYFDYINNLKILKTSFINNTNTIEFTENITIEAENYAQNLEGKFFIVANVFNLYNDIPQRYRNRQFPLEIERGFVKTDEITLTIPQKYSIETLPENINISTIFGEYTLEFIKKTDNQLLYKRKLYLKSGLHDKTQYDVFRKFMEQIAKNDNAKLIISKK